MMHLPENLISSLFGLDITIIQCHGEDIRRKEMVREKIPLCRNFNSQDNGYGTKKIMKNKRYRNHPAMHSVSLCQDIK